MARRKSGIQEFIEGFNGVYNTSRDVIGDIKTAKVANADVEEVKGEDGTSTYKFLGKDYTEKPSDGQIDYARAQGMADVEKKFGDPAAGMRMNLLASAQKKNADADDYTKAQAEWYKNSDMGKEGAAYQAQLADWQKATKGYEDQIAQGAKPEALGLPPAKPEAPTQTYLDMLNNTASYLNFNSEHGKFDPQANLSLGKALKDVQDEGAIDALRAMNAGDLDGALKIWNESGKSRIDPASVVAFNPVKVSASGTPMDTYEMKVKQPDGSIMTINAFKQLDAYGKATELFNRSISSQGNARANAASGRAAATFAQGQADRKTEQTEKAAKNAAGLALFQEQNPDATDAQLAAVKTGVTKPVSDEKGDYVPPTSDIRAEFSTPAVDEKGNPITDPLTGKQQMIRNPEKEAEFADFMADHNITDAKKGYILFQKARRTGEKKAEAATLAKIPDTEAAAHAAAAKAVKAGADLEEVNRRLKARGYRTLKPK